MKKTITIILPAMLAVICAFFAVSCGDTQENVVKPEFQNIFVDVTDRPSAFSLGDYTFRSVTVNGKELTENEYIVKNGYFIFKVDYYGELGTGKNNVSMVFSEETL